MKKHIIWIALVFLGFLMGTAICFAQDAPPADPVAPPPAADDSEQQVAENPDNPSGDAEAAPGNQIEPVTDEQPEATIFLLPEELKAQDLPNDGGQAVQILWKKPDKEDLSRINATLVITRKGPDDSEFKEIGEASAADGKYLDQYTKKIKDKPAHLVENGMPYMYQIYIREYPGQKSEEMLATSKGQWFNTDYWAIFIATALYIFLVAFFINRARGGKKMYVRPIAGINAVEEAVGRATEMGKPVLYIPGIGEIQEVATLAALTILSPIAQKVAEYNTPIMVPNRDPVVYTVAQEVVREAYLKAGSPDAYQEDNIYFLSGRQFAYAAAVSGMMLRERPGTNFYFGVFYAESLILAETGATTGAIQIAGTDQVAQLPFFIAACDYTLIGEELYAASAYLGDDPVLIGSLKALDYAKVVILGYLAIGAALGIAKIQFLANLL